MQASVYYVTSKRGFVAFKVDIISMKIHCCHGLCHDETNSLLKCYVTCGHNIIYGMT